MTVLPCRPLDEKGLLSSQRQCGRMYLSHQELALRQKDTVSCKLLVEVARQLLRIHRALCSDEHLSRGIADWPAILDGQNSFTALQNVYWENRRHWLLSPVSALDTQLFLRPAYHPVEHENGRQLTIAHLDDVPDGIVDQGKCSLIQSRDQELARRLNPGNKTVPHDVKR